MILKKLTPEQQQDWETWRYESLVLSPYLSAVITRLRPLNSVGLGTLASDSSFHIFIDFDFLESQKNEGLDIKEMAKLVTHEAWHIAKGHQEAIANSGEPEKSQLYNVAMDLDLNDDIPGISAPGSWTAKTACIPGVGMFGEFEKNLHWTTYLEKLKEKAEEAKQKSRGQSGDGEGDGQGEQGSNNSGSQKGNSPLSCGIDQITDEIIKDAKKMCGDKEVSPMEREAVRQAVAKAVTEAIERGEIHSDELSEWARSIIKPPTVPWRKILQSKLTKAITDFSDRRDYTPKRQSHRYRSVESRVFFPAYRRQPENVPNVVVGIDVSGSMSLTGVMDSVVNELDGLMKQHHIKKLNFFRVDSDVFCDKNSPFIVARTIKEVTDKLGFAGGTDMRVGFNLVRDLPSRLRPDIFILCTDGETPWPTEPIPGVKSFAVIVQNFQPEDCRISEIRERFDVPEFCEIIPVPAARD